jgi:hypothetical protein
MTLDDRFTTSGRLRPFSAGGNFALCMHNPDLAHCAGGRAFAAVISPRRQTTPVIKKANCHP